MTSAKSPGTYKVNEWGVFIYAHTKLDSLQSTCPPEFQANKSCVAYEISPRTQACSRLSSAVRLWSRSRKKRGRNELFNPFTPKSDQFQLSPYSLTWNITSHSMENLAFHCLLRWTMIMLPILTTSLIHFSLYGWENGLFELGGERVQIDDHRWTVIRRMDIYLEGIDLCFDILVSYHGMKLCPISCWSLLLLQYREEQLWLDNGMERYLERCKCARERLRKIRRVRACSRGINPRHEYHWSPLAKHSTAVPLDSVLDSFFPRHVIPVNLSYASVSSFSLQYSRTSSET